MRDPFDTGSTLRLGDAKAKSPEPEAPEALEVAIKEHVKAVSEAYAIPLWRLIGDVHPEARSTDRPFLDLFTAAFAPRTLPTEEDLIEDFDRYAYHDALVAKKADPK